MNIIFMGTPDFAVPSLEILLENNYTVSAVVTAPDKPRGRGQHVSVTPVKEAALKHSLPLLHPESLKDPEFVSQLLSYNPDLIVVVAFRILPREVYTIASLGAFNLHASLLPKYRGAAPINWAIINGEKESGVTTFFLQDKVDTGSVILQKAIPVSDHMNAGELHDALSAVGSTAVLETVRLIERGNVRPQQQDDSLASPAPKIFKEHCRINWNQSTEKIRNFIRGLSPYPSAWTMHEGKVIKIFGGKRSAEPHSDSILMSSTPGAIHTNRTQIFVRAGDGILEIIELQQEGKKRMAVEEFLRGYTFKGADHFQ